MPGAFQEKKLSYSCECPNPCPGLNLPPPPRRPHTLRGALPHSPPAVVRSGTLCSEVGDSAVFRWGVSCAAGPLAGLLTWWPVGGFLPGNPSTGGQHTPHFPSFLLPRVLTPCIISAPFHRHPWLPVAQNFTSGSRLWRGRSCPFLTSLTPALVPPQRGPTPRPATPPNRRGQCSPLQSPQSVPAA